MNKRGLREDGDMHPFIIYRAEDGLIENQLLLENASSGLFTHDAKGKEMTTVQC